MYEVLSFQRCRKGGVQRNSPLQVGGAEGARRVAKRLAANGLTAVVIFRANDYARVMDAYGDLADVAASYASD